MAERQREMYQDTVSITGETAGSVVQARSSFMSFCTLLTRAHVFSPNTCSLSRSLSLSLLSLSLSSPAQYLHTSVDRGTPVAREYWVPVYPVLFVQCWCITAFRPLFLSETLQTPTVERDGG